MAGGLHFSVVRSQRILASLIRKQVSEFLFNYLNYKHILSKKSRSGDNTDCIGIPEQSLFEWLVQLTCLSFVINKDGK